jgi:hypothetical protein
MVDRKRGDAPLMILKYLTDNGPAFYEKISTDLDIPKSTVENAIRKILIKRHGLVRKLPNDKFAVEWHTDEEEAAKTLKKKLLRNPLPEELAAIIRKSPSDARDTLFKFIPGYREPTDDEIECSAKTLWKTIVIGAVSIPTRRELYEMGIVRVIIEGIDQKIVEEIVEDRPSISLNEAKSYVDEFPEMKPVVISFRDNDLWIIKLEWRDEAKRALGILDSMKQEARIEVPRRYVGSIQVVDIWESIRIAEILSDTYVPSEEIINFLLNLGTPDSINIKILTILEKFCKNALIVDQINEETKDRIAKRLFMVALPDKDDDDADHIAEQVAALGILKMMGLKNDDFRDFAWDYLEELLNREPGYWLADSQYGGNSEYVDTKYLCSTAINIAKWLAEDPKMRKELKEKLEHILKETELSSKAAVIQKILENI